MDKFEGNLDRFKGGEMKHLGLTKELRAFIKAIPASDLFENRFLRSKVNYLKETLEKRECRAKQESVGEDTIQVFLDARILTRVG